MTVQATSLEAYEYACKTLSARQSLVFRAIRHHQPVTNYELSVLLNKPINTITPRTKELRQKGLVVQYGKKIDVTGRRAIQWCVAYIKELF